MSFEDRRQAIVDRLKSVRETYEKCVGDVTAEIGNNGSEWSLADLLRHVSSEGNRDRITRLLEEDHPQFPSFDREDAWRLLIDVCLQRVNEALEMASTLTTEQLARQGTRGGQPQRVVDALETWTAHLEEHLAQLRTELRPREGLPNV